MGCRILSSLAYRSLRTSRLATQTRPSSPWMVNIPEALSASPTGWCSGAWIPGVGITPFDRSSNGRFPDVAAMAALSDRDVHAHVYTHVYAHLCARAAPQSAKVMRPRHRPIVNRSLTLAEPADHCCAVLCCAVLCSAVRCGAMRCGLRFRASLPAFVPASLLAVALPASQPACVRVCMCARVCASAGS